VGRRYPLTILSGRVSKETSRLVLEERRRDEEARKRDEQEKVLLGSFLARLEPLKIGKRYAEALALVEEMQRQDLRPGGQEEGRR